MIVPLKAVIRQSFAPRSKVELTALAGGKLVLRRATGNGKPLFFALLFPAEIRIVFLLYCAKVPLKLTQLYMLLVGAFSFKIFSYWNNNTIQHVL
jgi:hypothetical protein